MGSRRFVVASAFLALIGALVGAAPRASAVLPPLRPVSNVHYSQWIPNTGTPLWNANWVSDTDGPANVTLYLIAPGGTTSLDEYNLQHSPAITVPVPDAMVLYNAKRTSSGGTLNFYFLDDKAGFWKGPFNAPLDQTWGNYNTDSFPLGWSDRDLVDAWATLSRLQAQGSGSGAVWMDECRVHLMPRGY